MDLLNKLEKYYDDKGISTRNFSCKHRGMCEPSTKIVFTGPKSALVGKKYGSCGIPRLLFISLDQAAHTKSDKLKSADELVSLRTAEGVRTQYEEDGLDENKKKNHWYRTHELACELLKPFKPDMTVESVLGRFAHTNSAKCCANNPGRSQAPRMYFIKCREYIPEEVCILNPEIIVTQGDFARDSIKGEFQTQNAEKFIATDKWDLAMYPDISVINVREIPVLWIHTYHPNQRRNYYREKVIPQYGVYSQITHEFIKAKRREYEAANPN